MIFAIPGRHRAGPAPASVALHDVPVFSWFARFDADGFYDTQRATASATA